MTTATLEIDQTLLQTLQAQANNQGLSIDALLRKLTENGNGTENYPLKAQANGVATQTPDEKESLGDYLLEKHEDEKRRFFALEEIAEKQGVTPQEWVRQNCPNGKDLQGRSLAQILDGIAEYKQQFDYSNSTIGERLEKRGLLGAIDSSQPDPDSPPHRDTFFYLIADELEKQGFKL